MRAGPWVIADEEELSILHDRPEILIHLPDDMREA